MSSEQLEQTLAKEDDPVEEESNAKTSKPKSDIFEGLEEFSMDDYSDEEDKTENFASLQSLYLPSAEEKKYEACLKEEDDSEGEEAMNLVEDDNLLVCANLTEGYSKLLVKVYNHRTKDFYVHHQVPFFKKIIFNTT